MVATFAKLDYAKLFFDMVSNTMGTARTFTKCRKCDSLLHGCNSKSSSRYHYQWLVFWRTVNGRDEAQVGSKELL